MQSQNVPLSAAMIQEKPLIFTKELNVETFQVINGCLQRWMQRNHITFQTVSGELKSVTPEMVNGCWEMSFLTLLSNYELTDIYSVDEFGLFYEFLPNKTYQIKSEKCSDRKLSKIGITSLAVPNVGDKLPMFVLGKAKKSWCLKNVKFLPCYSRNQ